MISTESWAHWAGVGRRAAAMGIPAPAGGLVQRDAPPHFLFRLAEKKTGRARSKRKERFWSQLCTSGAKLLYGGRRIGASADLSWPSGTLCSSAIFVTAVPWRMVPTSSGCKNAFDQLLFPRVPLRYALPGRS